MVDQNVCDRVIQHVCKTKPYAPMLLAIYAERIETVYCTMRSHLDASGPVGVPAEYEKLFAQQFHQMLQPQGRPLYLAQAGVVSLVGESGKPTTMLVCISNIEGTSQISYMANLKSCLCCYETLSHAPAWKGVPNLLGQVVQAFKASAPVAFTSQDIKFSNN